MRAATCNSLAEVEPRRPEGRPPRARNGGRQGRLADRLGGPGDAVNRVNRPAGDITCLACPPPHSLFFVFSFLHHIGSSLVSLSASFLRRFSLHSVASPRFLVVIAILALSSSACVSPRRSNAQMDLVLSAQAVLLEKLKVERRHPPLVKKLHSDDMTSAAEMRLGDAIDELIKANAELRSALRNR